MFDPEPRSSSHRVLQNPGSYRNQGLSGIVSRHFQASTAKTELNTLQDPFLKHHLFFDDAGHHLFSNVVLGGTQSPGGNDKFGPFDGLPQYLFEAVFAVSHNGL